ncbi:hypothetical protein OG373_36870 [Streptomyces avidinii]|uniref:hypothetical protein n=1 Tax=Streptomyces avidinii TaxID=1895 RepID=UPI00386C7F23|nr:hypothetical protein OG373_36870 [Streptomyces avidinii]
MIKTRKHAIRALGVTAAAVSILTLASSPASAATRTAYYGSDYVTGRPNGYNNAIFVKDNTADGHGVYANVHFNNGEKAFGYQSSKYAPNGLWAGGSSSGGATYVWDPSTYGVKVDWVQVCRDTVGCSSWVPVYDGS